MKQLILVLICINFIQPIVSQNINFPDAALKSKLVNQRNPTIDTNNDDEISISEAQAITSRLLLRGNSTGYISDLSGIEFFSNATELQLQDNDLVDADLSSNTALKIVDLSDNNLTAIDFSNNIALELIAIGSNNLTELDLTNNINLKVLGCTNMTMESLNVSTCVQLEELNCAINQFTSLDLTNNSALKTVFAHSLPVLTNLDLSNNLLLETIDCSGGGFTTLDVSGNPLLSDLDCSFGQVSNLIFGANNTMLTSLTCQQSPLTTIDTSLLSGLTTLILNNNSIASIDLSQNLNLEVLELEENQLTTIDLEQNPNLETINLLTNQLQNVYLRNGNNSGISRIELNYNPELYCLFVDDASINYSNWFRGGAVTLVETEEECEAASVVTEIPDSRFEIELIIQGYDTSPSNGEIPTSKINNITELNIESSQITDLTGLQDFVVLEDLDCSFNPLTNLDVSSNSQLRILNASFLDLETAVFGNNPNLRTIRVDQSKLVSVDLSGVPNLSLLDINDNNLTSLDVSNNLLLDNLDVFDNPISVLDFRNNNIRTLNCQNTLVETLDFSNFDNINIIRVNNNPNLTYINFKSGGNENIQQIFSITFSGLPNLLTACVDDVDNTLAQRIQAFTDQNVTLTEDCLNEISGKVSYDINNDNCQTSDVYIENLMIKSASAVDTTATFTSLSGTYVNYVSANTYLTSLESSLPEYFTVMAPTQTSLFTDFNNIDIVDFCVEANQSIEDLNIVLIPINEARPGFNSKYQLVYNNIGTNVANGAITIVFDDSKSSFVSSTQVTAAQTPNSLTFDFIDLNPFESRFINLELNIFTPPTVNDGDVLEFVASIMPSTTDFTPDDNTYFLNQGVVNSFDPNDKQILQGASILIEEKNKYLDYVVRFQNTGSASAINVRIEDILSEKLNWATLQPIGSSHNYRVEITNDNFVEFIFDGINLPPQSESEELSQGYIAFRIKPKDNVSVGDIISGTADIFFDFNEPITTNTVTTEIVEPLSVEGFNFQILNLYPNPAKDLITIKSQYQIDDLLLIDINGRILESIEISTNEYVLDISKLSKGVYFIEVKTLAFKSTKKFIKN